MRVFRPKPTQKLTLLSQSVESSMVRSVSSPSDMPKTSLVSPGEETPPPNARSREMQNRCSWVDSVRQKCSIYKIPYSTQRYTPSETTCVVFCGKGGIMFWGVLSCVNTRQSGAFLYPVSHLSNKFRDEPTRSLARQAERPSQLLCWLLV